MSKQTAVEWLVEQLECFGNKHELLMSWATVDELVAQAKAMEREQIDKAYTQGGWDEINPKIESRVNESGKIYYNQTYKGGEQ